MTITLLHRIPVAPVEPSRLSAVVADARDRLGLAADLPVEQLDDDAIGDVVATLAVVESRAAALRMTLAVEADRRQVAETTAETGTDAWLARLTGSTGEQAAGGLRIARLLQQRYATTREAFASGLLRPDQVRVIVHAAEQAPVEASGEQVRQAEEWLVAKATGAGTRSGRGMDAKRLRQSARRMFAAIDHDLADRHEAILLGRETRTAEADTFFALHDNGDGSYSGRFRIPELHGRLLTHVLDRLTAPRRLSRDASGRQVVDPTAPGTSNIYETYGSALCELVEHLPMTGWPGHGGNSCEVVVTIDLATLRSDLSGLGVAGLDSGIAITAGRGPPPGLRRRTSPRRPRWQVDAAGPGPVPPAAQRDPTPRARPAPRDLRRDRLRATLRLVRDPPPAPLVPGWPHGPRQRPASVRAPPPPGSRREVRPSPKTRRRVDLPPPDVSEKVWTLTPAPAPLAGRAGGPVRPARARS